jgi:exosortase/archaeosortase family protein
MKRQIMIGRIHQHIGSTCAGFFSERSSMRGAVSTSSDIVGRVERKITNRLVLAFAAIPTAIAANGLRIAVDGMVLERWGFKEAQGTFHKFSGWLIFMGAVAMLSAFHHVWATCWPGVAESGESARLV